MFDHRTAVDFREGLARETELTGQERPSYLTGRDIRKGFVYKRVPHVTLKSIANNPDIKEGMIRDEIDAAIRRHAETETLYDQPYEDKSRIRVSGRGQGPVACCAGTSRSSAQPSRPTASSVLR